MTTTTTRVDLADELGDSSGATGTHPDFIRKIADQNPRMTLSLNDASSTDQSALDTENRGDTAVGFHQLAPVTLFLDKPRTRSAEASFYPLQEWEGYVVSITDDTFTARLVDLTTNDGIEEEADFPIAELSAADQGELRPGAIFRWAIGYRRTRSGNKKRFSRIVLRRLPAWTESELERIRQEAEALASALHGE